MIPTSPTDVSALVRSVIVTHRLPFAILAVTKSPTAWNILVRAGTGGLVRFAVAEGRDLTMRMDIQEKLEAEL
jgi:hypothetical protein